MDLLFIPWAWEAERDLGPAILEPCEILKTLLNSPENMAFPDLLITEIFHSIQGETSLAGERFSFIRLTGCNLRCVYCDSAYAFKGGKKMSILEIENVISEHKTDHILITGGEPLLQRNTPELVRHLAGRGWKVSMETHGELDISPVKDHARIVMDIKTPGSKMHRGGYLKNLPLLSAKDEIKFVICNDEDFHWARQTVREKLSDFKGVILFSTGNPHPESPGEFEGYPLKLLAENILESKLNVRLQTQLHKQIWDPAARGV